MDQALREGVVLRCSHGRYALPEVAEAVATAHRVNGILSLTSAALHHGWEVKAVPERPHVLFPRKRNIPRDWREQVVVHRGDVHSDGARGDAANAFESVARAICLTVPGLRVEPQVVISSPRCWARPDLVDEDLHVVVECDSFEWHGNRAGFRKDVRRYPLLTADGWMVLHFTWEDVMFRADWVREVLCRAVSFRLGHARTLVPAAWSVAA